MRTFDRKSRPVDKLILGVSAHYHDSAASLLRGSEFIAAAQEERFTRRKFEPGFPVNAIRFCLDQAKACSHDLDAIAYYEDPAKKLHRIMASLHQGIGDLRTILDTWTEKTDLVGEIRRLTDFEGPIRLYDHHQSHAACAYYLSLYPESAILVADGVGEWATTSFSYGQEGSIRLLREIDFPHSLGLFYSAVTAFLGFQTNSDEYKVMGMAAYGRSRYADRFRKIVRVAGDGVFTLDMRYFDYNHKMYSEEMQDLLGMPPRVRRGPLEPVHFDVASSAQVVLEEALLQAVEWLATETQSKNLCLAGGVALNCLANARLRDHSPFDNIFVPPAAGDAGGCLGAALLARNDLEPRPKKLAFRNARLGPEFDESRIGRYLERIAVKAKKMTPDALVKHCAELLSRQLVVGWFQGRLEFGPRALGGRSILADPRSPAMKESLNLKIKKREGFRPFAPICTEEAASDYFHVDRPYPFMTFIVDVKDKDALGAVCHQDGTARLQTVSRQSDPLMHALLEAFAALTGVPALLNTSMNVSGEPIVCGPEDAFNCFRESGMDALVMGPYVIERRHQPPELVEPGTHAYRSIAREVEPYLKDTYFFS